ncbi:MAG TPA: preprotein translocase subunit YajC [Dehalococcoidales bacterium]|nr:preprotein translocase subunit YajC [Dehalococcoidales bacterium]
MRRIVSLSLIAVLLIGILAVASGCLAPAGGTPQEPGSIWPMIIFLVVIFGLFYLLMIRPQRRRQKQHETLMRELQKGDRVMTAGGIYGTIDSLAEDSVVIKVESGTTLRVARGSVVLRQEK